MDFISGNFCLEKYSILKIAEFLNRLVGSRYEATLINTSILRFVTLPIMSLNIAKFCPIFQIAPTP